MKQLPLTKGYIATIDDADYPIISRWKWRALVRKSKFTTRVYAVRQDHMQHHCILMHRVIASAPSGMVVDHVNGDTLDNRRENIRVCTQAQNLQNQGPRGNCVSGLKGVRKFRSKWMATITANGTRHYLGLFPDAESGAKAYDEAARRLHGNFARLNFPDRERAMAMLVNSYVQGGR